MENETLKRRTSRKLTFFSTTKKIMLSQTFRQSTTKTVHSEADCHHCQCPIKKIHKKEERFPNKESKSRFLIEQLSKLCSKLV